MTAPDSWFREESDRLAIAELSDPNSAWFREWLADDVWHTEVAALAVAAMSRTPAHIQLAVDALNAAVRASAAKFICSHDGWNYAHRWYRHLTENRRIQQPRTDGTE